MEASPSRNDSFAREWLGCRARLDADPGHSFGSSTSFIDIDPDELFSMRWTSMAAVEALEEDVVFHSAQSTPISAVGSRVGAFKPLLATRRILLRYLRFLAPLCRKARAAWVFAPRSGRSALAGSSSSSARQSTSSYASAAEYWCNGHADTAVREAILHCKKSIQADM